MATTLPQPTSLDAPLPEGEWVIGLTKKAGYEVKGITYPNGGYSYSITDSPLRVATTGAGRYNTYDDLLRNLRLAKDVACYDWVIELIDEAIAYLQANLSSGG